MGGPLHPPHQPAFTRPSLNLFQRGVETVLNFKSTICVLLGIAHVLVLYSSYWLVHHGGSNLLSWALLNMELIPVLVSVMALLTALSATHPSWAQSILRALQGFLLDGQAKKVGYTIAFLIWIGSSIVGDVLPLQGNDDGPVHWTWLMLSAVISCTVGFLLARVILTDDCSCNCEASRSAVGSSIEQPDDRRRREQAMDERIKMADKREQRLNAERQSLRRQRDLLNFELLNRDKQHQAQLEALSKRKEQSLYRDELARQNAATERLDEVSRRMTEMGTAVQALSRTGEKYKSRYLRQKAEAEERGNQLRDLQARYSVIEQSNASLIANRQALIDGFSGHASGSNVLLEAAYVLGGSAAAKVGQRQLEAAQAAVRVREEALREREEDPEQVDLLSNLEVDPQTQDSRPQRDRKRDFQATVEPGQHDTNGTNPDISGSTAASTTIPGEAGPRSKQKTSTYCATVESTTESSSCGEDSWPSSTFSSGSSVWGGSPSP
jgi:hypothetical protein